MMFRDISHSTDSPSDLPEPPRRWVGLGIVAALHVAMGWALVNGLARKVIDVVRPTVVETVLIEPERPPEPPPAPAAPPPPAAPTPPKAPPPPPAYVPRPEVAVTTPPAPTISTTSAPTPPADVQISTAPPAVTAPPAPPPAPVVRTQPSLNFGVCRPEYPPAAMRAEAEGVVVVAFTMDTDGHISEAHVEQSAGPTREHKQLDRATLDAVLACKGRPGTVDGRPERLSSRVRYRWTLDN